MNSRLAVFFYFHGTAFHSSEEEHQVFIECLRQWRGKEVGREQTFGNWPMQFDLRQVLVWRPLLQSGQTFGNWLMRFDAGRGCPQSGLAGGGQIFGNWLMHFDPSHGFDPLCKKALQVLLSSG
ncbi:hypothetical protein HRbin36_02738 [bacterium HR36]|nr:hypothetical protein HRbin36_02738 [bacterium HR36]